VTPFISHARNHKPAGGPASSRAACRASMARRHGPFAQHGAAQRYRLHFPRGGRCLWASCGRRFGPGWPCSDPGTHGGPFLSREVESEATRTEVQSVCTSPQTACMPILRAGRLSPSLETSRWDFWRARRFRCGWWFHYLPRFQCSVSSLPLHPDSDDCKCDKEDTNGNHARTHGHPNCGNRSARRLIWWW